MSGSFVENAAHDEAGRLRALRSLEILDSAPEAVFDEVAQMAANICNTPVALVNLLDEKRQWFKARVGMSSVELPRESSFCDNLIGQTEPLVVSDALKDPRFCGNPCVTGEPHVQFYAGIPLTTTDGFTLGSLCVIDTVSHDLTENQLEALKALGRQVAMQMELRAKLKQLNDTIRLKHSIEDELKRQNLLFAAFMEHSPTMAFIKDDEGRFVYYNRWFCERYEVSPSEWIGKSVFDLFPEEFADAYHAADMDVLRSGVSQTIEEASPGPHETMQYWRTHKFRISGINETLLLGGISLDISSELATVARLRSLHEKLEAENKELARRSSTDALTGLCNRRAFDERLAATMQNGKVFSLVLLDIDHFKAHNDSYGHQHGDEVLKTVATLLKQDCRGMDFIARIGGEEFAVLLSDTNSTRALKTADRLRKAIQNYAWQHAPVTISAGVSSISAILDSAPKVFEAADAALYRAKRAGRNRVRVRNGIALHASGLPSTEGGRKEQKLTTPVTGALRLPPEVNVA